MMTKHQIRPLRPTWCAQFALRSQEPVHSLILVKVVQPQDLKGASIMHNLLTSLILACTASLLYGASFQNLDFENANTNALTVFPGRYVSGFGPTSELLPNWELTQG